MSPYQAYKLYLATKLHFTSPEYDVFKTNGAVRAISEEKFQADKRYQTFKKFSEKYKNPKDIIDVFVSTFAYGKNVFNVKEVEDAYKLWRKHKEMMTQLILDDIDVLESLNTPLKEIVNGSPSPLIKQVASKKINIETATAINRKYHCVGLGENNFTHPTLGIIVNKLDGFIRFNEEKVYCRLSELDHEKSVF